MSSSQLVLQVQALARSGLAPVSFGLAKGGCLAVTGPSGAGKSLLLRAIADLDVNEGEILLENAPRSAMPAPQWRRRVVYVPAEPGWWGVKVADHFQAWEKASPWVEALGLPADCRDWEIGRASTGERQRLALARALALEPAVLLCDEPTSALDAGNVGRVEAVFRRFLGAGGAMLVVTHDTALAGRLASAGSLEVRDGRVEVNL